MTRRRAAPESTPPGTEQNIPSEGRPHGDSGKRSPVRADAAGLSGRQAQSGQTAPMAGGCRQTSQVNTDTPGEPESSQVSVGTARALGRHARSVRHTGALGRRSTSQRTHRRNSGGITEQENTGGKEGLSSGHSNRVRGTRETSFVTVNRPPDGQTVRDASGEVEKRPGQCGYDRGTVETPGVRAGVPGQLGRSQG